MINDSLNIHGVRRTALEALSCKISAKSEMKNNANDLPESLNRRKSPLLNRVYMMRSTILHHIIDISLEVEIGLWGGCHQFLSLGGGLDTSYDAKVECPSFIVDLPEVINQRFELFQQLDDEQRSSMHRPTLVSGDLKAMDQVMESLVHSGLRLNEPTIVLIECVLSYLPLQDHHNVLSTLSRCLHPDSILITYDPHIAYRDHENLVQSFSDQMLQRFQKRGAPLLGAHVNIVEHMRFLYRQGWCHNVSMTMNQAWKLFISDAQRYEILYKTCMDEPFDEAASLLLLNSLYGISISSRSSAIFTTLWNKLLSRGNAQDLITRAAIAEARCVALESYTNQRRTQCLDRRSDTEPVFLIREAAISDSAVLAELYQKSFESYCLQHKSVAKFVASATKDLKKLEKHYPPESHSKLFIASDGKLNNVVGCIGLKVYSKIKGNENMQIFEISHFCVDVESRRQGVGRLLLDKAINYGISIDATRIQLTVLQDLVEARQLYQKVGFKEIKVIDIGNNCILHHLELE